jgi:hypothetical protein
VQFLSARHVVKPLSTTDVRGTYEVQAPDFLVFFDGFLRQRERQGLKCPSNSTKAK